ncbi:phosphopantothenoylcysteine decarboxylase [Ammoniphilus oxalaticus]|uniref:Coenzyme A biosynthesis bifunctional protein CoaBC n=1 Tax=Ammoniphilus oxalaticus TaxID=66863 RepID=A0A419SJK5_9BACL|nr:bifunctional phosphopantothenoylcysteine decarboxylase/phosphopantothenate--cysteine ligase CoaBC [Ammoniphilus oxalaticus]RKD24140.1 phosphopantothenoylcysteine decarboxylase [Ammoniphilus oxalaticus]
MLHGKTIVLGVTGGIAAYKAAALCSALVQKGAEVHVILTASAAEFIQPLTFQALSRRHVIVDMFVEQDPTIISHIDLADRADLVVIAPTTANVIAKATHGIADDMLTTMLLATRAPVMICPAMNVHMYEHVAVQQNMDTLRERGVLFVEPAEGFLACGYVGKGRMAEPDVIADKVVQFFTKKQDLHGKTVLVTAGATREAFDPIRFITNRSTGKMGYAIAEGARARGAKVILVSGITHIAQPSGVQTRVVESAEDMYQTVCRYADEADVIIKSAAVSDYRPIEVHDQKVKKKDGNLVIEFARTKDILKHLGEHKQANQILIGFAAETERVEEYAMEKIMSKNLDFIVANNVAMEGAGFGTDTNIVSLYDQAGLVFSLPQLSKREVAERILDEVVARSKGKNTCMPK